MDFLLDSVAVAGTLLVAALAVIWPDELKALSKGDLSAQAVTFIGTVIATVAVSACAGIRRRGEATRARVAVALERKVRALADALPRALAGYRGEHPDAAVRLVLRALAEAAWSFDGKPKGARYATNVMIFVLKEPRPAVFRDADVPTTGFLVLHKQLSTTLLGTEGAPDSTIAELVLPVPEEGERCLPGAPLAFRENSTDFYSDATKLAAWCRSRRFPVRVQDQVRQYFAEEGVLVRSMLSVALPANGADPFAVLNVHRHRPGMFRAGDGAPEFVEIAEPLLKMLSEEIATWSRKAQNT